MASHDAAAGSVRVLLLTPPREDSADGSLLAGGIGAVEYPAAAAIAAAAIGNSKLIDAAADRLTPAQIVLLAKGFDLCALFADGSTLDAAASAARRLKSAYPAMRIGLLADFPGGLRENPPASASPFAFVLAAYDFRGLREAAGTPNAPCGGEHDATAFPSVLDIYRRDLTITRYHLPYLRFPHVTLPARRGAWKRLAADIVDDAARALMLFPRLQEIFIYDDALLAHPERALEIAQGLGKTGIPWSARVKACGSNDLLEPLRANGLRLLSVDCAPAVDGPTPLFTRRCRQLGIRVHGRFVLGGESETRRSIRQTIRYACDLDIDSIHVDTLPSPVSSELDEEDIIRGLYRMYARFYLRPGTLWRTLQAVWRHPCQRRLRYDNGSRFIRSLWRGPKTVTS